MPGLPEGDGQPEQPKDDGALGFTVDESVWLFLRDTLAAHLKQEPAGLRISVRGGGCSGLSYHFEMGQEKPGDHVFSRTWWEDFVDYVYVDRRSMLFLKGSTLVYEKGDFASLLKLRNPNAKSTCGCGESFSV